MSVFHSYPADEQPEPEYDRAAALVRTNRQATYARYATARTRWLDARKRGHVIETAEAWTALISAWKQMQRL